jgi:hypothetical protein
MYGSCKTRKDIEVAREHLKTAERVNYLLKLAGNKSRSGKSLDAFDNVEVWRNE